MRRWTQAAWREKANTPLFARNVPRPPNMNLASMGDCYGDSFTSDTFSSELSYELSGGFNEVQLCPWGTV